MKSERSCHLRRARARAIASSAEIEPAVPASSSASRRTASSTHSCSISASERDSRLFRSSWARLARDEGSSASAARLSCSTVTNITSLEEGINRTVILLLRRATRRFHVVSERHPAPMLFPLPGMVVDDLGTSWTCSINMSNNRFVLDTLRQQTIRSRVKVAVSSTAWSR